MTTEQIANRLVELCRQGQHEQAYRELFADDAVAIDPGNPQGDTKGLDNLLAKSKQFSEMMEEMHDASTSDPLVAGNQFVVHMMIDSTMKGRSRSKEEELAMYFVENGKIVKEQFFYDMPPAE